MPRLPHLLVAAICLPGLAGAQTFDPWKTQPIAPLKGGIVLAGGGDLPASVRQAFLPEDPALVAAEITADPDAIDASGRASRTGCPNGRQAPP